jgi:G3E family GTPase
MDVQQKIPVHIITGFLGSGKTTFLNNLIKNASDKRVVVIENEVGKVNIDGAMIIDSVDDVIELTAGCLCCNLNEKLYNVLKGLVERKDEFDILVIETTGIADPAGVVETFWIDGYMERNFNVMSTICLADAQNMRTSIEITEEARRQIAFADIVLLNKTDGVPVEELASLTSLINDINPGVVTYHGEFGKFPCDKILQYAAHSKVTIQNKIQALHNQYTHKHKGINTFTLTYDQPFDFNRLRHTLMLLIQVNKSQIYRIKGFVNVREMENRILIQSVYQSYRVEEGSPWEENEVRESKIVFIGNDVAKESIERMFKQCLLKPATSTF